MTEEDEGAHFYSHVSSEMKVIGYDEDSSGFYTIGVLKMDYDKHSLLESRGWPDTTYIFMNMGGGQVSATTRVRVFSNELSSYDDDMLKKLLVAIKEKGFWTTISDGEIYTPSEVEEMEGL